ncbi:MAG: hypothetical protein AB8G22_17740 [Saprospiraceae bacterium]
MLRKVNKEMYLQQPERYELRRGTALDAPLCPYGNHFEWIGYDKEQEEYVRFTKSVFKVLIQLQESTE